MLFFLRHSLRSGLTSNTQFPNITVRDAQIRRSCLRERLAFEPYFRSQKTILVVQPGLDHFQSTGLPVSGCQLERRDYIQRYHPFYQNGYRIVFLLPYLVEHELQELNRGSPLHVSHWSIFEEDIMALKRSGLSTFHYNGKEYPSPCTAIISTDDLQISEIFQRSEDPTQQIQTLLEGVIRSNPHGFKM